MPGWHTPAGNYFGNNLYRASNILLGSISDNEQYDLTGMDYMHGIFKFTFRRNAIASKFLQDKADFDMRRKIGAAASAGDGLQNYITDLSLTAGPGGANLWKIGELTYASPQALKQYLAIVVGESGNNMQEAQAIGSVIMNRLAWKGASLNGNFISKIGGVGQYDAIGGDAYNAIMNSSWEDIFSSSNTYATRISGAFSPLVWNKDYSGGAYFWNATIQQNWADVGANWRNYYAGTFTITKSIGGSTFFRYTDLNKHWP